MLRMWRNEGTNMNWQTFVFLLVYPPLAGLVLALVFNYAIWANRYDGFWDFAKRFIRFDPK